MTSLGNGIPFNRVLRNMFLVAVFQALLGSVECKSQPVSDLWTFLIKLEQKSAFWNGGSCLWSCCFLCCSFYLPHWVLPVCSHRNRADYFWKWSCRQFLCVSAVDGAEGQIVTIFHIWSDTELVTILSVHIKTVILQICCTVRLNVCMVENL